MRDYELLYIIHADLDEEKTASVMKRYEDIIVDGKGILQSSEKWGKRRLAYELNGAREGLYILVLFQAEQSVSAEIDRLMKIDQDILRHMILRLDLTKRKTRRKKAEPPQAAPAPEESRVAAPAATPARVVQDAEPQ